MPMHVCPAQPADALLTPCQRYLLLLEGFGPPASKCPAQLHHTIITHPPLPISKCPMGINGFGLHPPLPHGCR